MIDLFFRTNSTVYAIDVTYNSNPSEMLLQTLLIELALFTSPNTATYNPATFVLYNGTNAW